MKSAGQLELLEATVSRSATWVVAHNLHLQKTRPREVLYAPHNRDVLRPLIRIGTIVPPVTISCGDEMYVTAKQF